MSNPHIWRVCHPLLFEFEGDSVIDIVADVFFVCKNFVDRALSPGAPQVRENAALVQHGRQPRLRNSLFDEGAIQPSNDFNFFWRSWDKNDAVRLDAFLLSAAQ